MDKFQILPTDERFEALTDAQVGFIMANMSQDVKEENLRRKGISPDSHFEDDDDSWWEQPHNEFEALKADDVEEDIAAQVDSMTRVDDLEKVKARFKNNDDWVKYLENGGAEAKKMATEDHIQEQLKKVYADAAEADKAGISKWGKSEIRDEEQKANQKLGELKDGDIQDAIDLFNGDTEDDGIIRPSMDDDFSI